MNRKVNTLNIKMTPIVRSSNILAAGYDETTGTLRIAFESGGSYDYRNVTKIMFEQLLRAPSVGRFFHSNIKGKFPTRMVPASPSSSGNEEQTS